MKSIAILSILFFSLLPNTVKNNNDYVMIEYVGDTNATMETIFISENRLPDSERVITLSYDSWPFVYLVYNNELTFIKKAIKTGLKKTFEEKDYNGFKITMRENNVTVYYFITRKDSNSLFLKINAYLKSHKGNKNLISALNGIRLSNVFPK